MIKLRSQTALIFTMLAALVAASILFLTGGPAFADSQQFCRFIGSLSTAEGEIGGATLVTAVIEGREYHTHTATVGDTTSYSITIVPPQDRVYSDGTPVRFKVDGRLTEQVGYFQTGTNVSLDLITSIPITTGYTGISPAAMQSGSSASTSSVSWVAIVGVLTVALVAAAITYYVILLRRAMRKGFISKRAVSNSLNSRRGQRSGTIELNR